MPFVRVRAVGDNAPPTEFDIPVGLLARRGECYEVVDPEPRKVAKAATFLVPEAPKRKPKKKAAEAVDEEVAHG